MRRLKPPADEFLTFGFASRRELPKRFATFHRHNEVEVDLLESGSATTLFGSGPLTLRKGRLTVIWGAVPHQLVEVSPNTVVHWLTIPLPWFLQWQLPTTLSRRVLRGEPLHDRTPGREEADLALFNQWHRDLKCGDTERRKLVLLEVEVRLRRMALALESAAAGPAAAAPGGLDRVAVMARHIAEHYTEPLRVPQIAAEARLHPDYACTLFRKTCGLHMMDYVARHRVFHAQRLLATTDMKILDIAFASGFGSASRFYAVFEKSCGQSPKAYRRAIQTGVPITKRMEK